MEQLAQSWNTELWIKTLNDAKAKGDAEEIRNVYDALLERFPTASRYWLSYLEFETSQANFTKVQDIFTRSLRTIVNVDLWRFYLSFVRQVSRKQTSSASDARQTISQAFEFALQHIGLDIDSSSIWMEYIDFVKSWEVNSPFEQGLQMETLRKIYHRAISIPLLNVELIWKDFDLYENRLNKVSAKKIIGEKSAAYMTARAALRDLKALLENLHSETHLSTPPAFGDKDHKLALQWKQWIAWEKTDPLRYDNGPALTARVMFAYKKALNELYYYPEIWLDAIMFLVQQNELEEARALCKTALSSNKTSLLLHFYAAELDEMDKNIEAGKEKFESLLVELQKQIDAVKPYLDMLTNFGEKENQKSRTKPKLMDEATTDGAVSADEDLEEQESDNDDAAANKDSYRNNPVYRAKESELNELGRLASLVWIQYMSFSRRTEGMKTARQIFSRARKTDYCSFQVYISSALMEYYSNKDKQVAFKIFEVGLKSFGDAPEYIMAYIDFLISTADDSNVRSLFERTLSTMSPERAKPLWLKFLDYESKFGDVSSIHSIEKRIAEAFSDEKVDAAHVAERYCYLDLREILYYELGLPLTAEKRALMPEHKTPETLHRAPQVSSSADVVILPTTKEEEIMYPAKKKALAQSSSKKKFPKPDMLKFVPFKDDPTKAQALESKRQELTESLRQKREDSSAPSVDSEPKSFVAETAGSIPFGIAQFIARLPPATLYHGPFLNVELLVEAIGETHFAPPLNYAPLTDRDRRPKRRR